MHELIIFEERIGDVSTKMIIEVIAQKLKISHQFSLNVMICPFFRGM
jgi:hypothetical protein